MFKNISIKLKFQLGFGFLLLLITIIAFVGWLGMNSCKNDLNEAEVHFSITILFAAVISAVILGYWIASGIVNQISTLLATAISVNNAIANGDFEINIDTSLHHEFGDLFRSKQSVLDNLLLLKKDMSSLAEYSAEGNLQRRLEIKNYVGDWQSIVFGVNAILDEALTPVNSQVFVLQNMLDGLLTSRFNDDFKGDHNRIKVVVNKISAVAEKALKDLEIMVTASREGDLKRRIPVDDYVGDWKSIMLGVNAILDEALTPVNSQAIVLQNMADGLLTSRITDDFKGDHNRIKDAVNKIAVVAEKALKDLELMDVAARENDLNRRIYEDDYVGDWKTIMMSVNSVAETIQVKTESLQLQNWLKTGITDLSAKISGDMLLEELAYQVISHLAVYLQAQIGAIYLWNEEDQYLHLISSYAYELRKNLSHKFALGEGLVGQAAREKQVISITDLPENYVSITSAIGSIQPRNAIVIPLLYEGTLKGVLELGSLHAFGPNQLDLLRLAAPNIGTAIFVAQSASRTKVLLLQSQEQSQRLQIQQEELQQSNEELEEQTQALISSEQQLKMQQEELQQINEELEERTQALEQQRSEIEAKNSLLEVAQTDLTQRAEDLAIASKYKGEFLANMSHELRTPLNSMLLLSRTLCDNRDGNLTDKQVEMSVVMHKSSNDLLNIINDILDLSKIESGHEHALIELFSVNEIVDQAQGLFRPVAEDKGLELIVSISDAVPKHFRTDRQRLGQILRNLLSNACKFTEKGSISLVVDLPSANIKLGDSLTHETTIVFSVKDTGSGIPKEKQAVIWEAFQQQDGSISRKHGGTGLGLTISRELTRLLGGEIKLVSEQNEGCTFSIYLPMNGVSVDEAEVAEIITSNLPATNHSYSKKTTNKAPQQAMAKPPVIGIADDRDNLLEGEIAIFIVEDDPHFAQILAEMCHENKHKYLATPTAEEALILLERYKIGGVLLDMVLPEKHGVIVLNHIKETVSLAHIPVYVMSTDESYAHARLIGALDFVTKPLLQEQLDQTLLKIQRILGHGTQRLLVLEDDVHLAQSIANLLGNDELEIDTALDGQSAIDLMQQKQFDLVVMDIGLPDMSGFELLKHIKQNDIFTFPPIIIYTGRELTRLEHETLQNYTNSIIAKSVHSDERLLSEARTFLHRSVERLPAKAQKMLLSLHNKDVMFQEKKVLVVDDDILNIFSLSSVLEARGIIVVAASSGKEALEKLKLGTTFDAILTDVMMPEMDGLELMRILRADDRYFRIPIIALTAKAMKEDRIICLEAGASDYLTKPIDVNRLLAMLRIWLYR